MNKLLMLLAGYIGLSGAWDAALAQGEPHAIPNLILPVPTHVSVELQRVLSEPPQAGTPFPKTPEQWRALAPPVDPVELKKEFAELSRRFGVKITSQRVGGAHCFVVKPVQLKPANTHRLVIEMHPGGFVYGGGSEVDEAVQMASVMGVKVIAVDYRMLPEHPFPAALEDGMTVWRAALRSTPARNIALLGSSTGGNLVLAMVQRAKKEGTAMPGAVMSGTPWADMSPTGDSYRTNKDIDHFLSTSFANGFWLSVAKLYAGARDLKDPEISPVYGSFTSFPPTILITGTRDLYLSNAVRVYHRLEEAGAPAQLEVEEAQPHLAYLLEGLGTPDGIWVYSRAAQFFNRYLGR